MIAKVYIVIVTYNGMKWLSKCLSSCATYDVIVVDNNSSDGTVPFIEKNFKAVTILKQNKNLGFGAANNVGIAYALENDADYVFLLNQDAYLKGEIINLMVDAHKSNPNYGILSPIHLNGEGMTLDHNFSKYIKVNTAFSKDIKKQSFSKQIYELPFVNAAAWFLPKETIETVGGFDPIFYHYGEDDNYCQRVLYHKLRIGIVADSYVLHDRELRPKRVLTQRIEKLAHFERSLKQSLGDINIDIETRVRLKKQILLKSVLKSFLVLKFNEVIFNIQKYKRLNAVLPEIRNSRKINKGIGRHYLGN